jgi:hypothetical protein
MTAVRQGQFLRQLHGDDFGETLGKARPEVEVQSTNRADSHWLLTIGHLVYARRFDGYADTNLVMRAAPFDSAWSCGGTAMGLRRDVASLVIKVEDARSNGACYFWSGPLPIAFVCTRLWPARKAACSSYPNLKNAMQTKTTPAPATAAAAADTAQLSRRTRSRSWERSSSTRQQAIAA